MGTRKGLVGLLMSVSLVTFGQAPVAAADGRVTAQLDGRAILLRDVDKYYCHDLDYPRITCSHSKAGADTQIARAVAARSASFVRLYDDVGYEGGSIALSRDYSDLGDIGWNDRASSFKVLNGGSGEFSEHVGPGGAHYSFCCTGAMSNLGSWNDRISAVEGSA